MRLFHNRKTFYKIILGFIITLIVAIPCVAKDMYDFIPYDTLAFLEANISEYDKLINEFLLKIMDQKSINTFINFIRLESISYFGIDWTDPVILKHTGFDLKKKAVLIVFDLNYNNKFIFPSFAFGIGISDNKKIHEFFKSAFISNGMKLISLTYKGIDIYTYINNSNKEVHSYMFIDDYMFIGDSSQLKHIINASYYNEAITQQQQFNYLMKSSSSDGQIKGYISYETISKLLLLDILQSEDNILPGSGTSFTIDFEKDSLRTNFYSAFNKTTSEERQKAIYKPDLKSEDLLAYLPEGNFSLINLRMNFIELLKGLPFAKYILPSAIVGLYYYSQESGIDLTMLRDLLSNLGVNLSLILYENTTLPGQTFTTADINALFFCEIQKKTLASNLIEKIWIEAANNLSANNRQINEIKIQDNYFYGIETDTNHLYLGIYDNYLIVATKKNTLTSFIENIKNKSKTEFISKLKNDNIDVDFSNNYINLFLDFSMVPVQFMAYDPRLLVLATKLKYLYFYSYLSERNHYGSLIIKFQNHAISSVNNLNPVQKNPVNNFNPIPYQPVPSPKPTPAPVENTNNILPQPKDNDKVINKPNTKDNGNVNIILNNSSSELNLDIIIEIMVLKEKYPDKIQEIYSKYKVTPEQISEYLSKSFKENPGLESEFINKYFEARKKAGIDK